MRPFITEPSLEIPGLEQFHDNIIDDFATRAEYYLEVAGPAYAYSACALGLQEMIDNRHPRAQAAYEVLTRIQQNMLVLVISCKEAAFDVESTLAHR